MESLDQGEEVETLVTIGDRTSGDGCSNMDNFRMATLARIQLEFQSVHPNPRF